MCRGIRAAPKTEHSSFAESERSKNSQAAFVGEENPIGTIAHVLFDCTAVYRLPPSDIEYEPSDWAKDSLIENQPVPVWEFTIEIDREMVNEREIYISNFGWYLHGLHFSGSEI